MWNCKAITRCLVNPDLRPSLTLVANFGWSSNAQPGGAFTKSALDAAKPFKEVPHLTMVPLLGTAWSFLPIIGSYDSTKPHLAMKDKRRRFGDLYRDRFVNLDIVFAFNPEDLRTVSHNEGEFPVRAEFTAMKKYRESRKHWYKKTGLLVMNGKEWRDLRTQAQRHLMSTSIVYGFSSQLQDVAKDLIGRIRMVMDPKQEVPNLINELYKWSLESVALIGLDTRLGCFKEDLSPDSEALRMINSVLTQFDCMNKLEGFMGNLPWWKLFRTPLWTKFENAADIYGEISFKYINRALENLETEKLETETEKKRVTLLQSMLLSGMDISTILVIVADMLSAGIETTSHTVSFLLYHLARNPDKQEILYKDITRLLPNKEDRMTADMPRNELGYLHICLKESQRLLPAVGGTIRTLEHDIILRGYRIPAKTPIVFGSSETCIDEQYFTDASLYIPERWTDKARKGGIFMPFGVGRRGCIGKTIATLEIITLIVELLRNFKVEYHYEDIGTMTRFINVPDKPLRFTFIER